MDLPGFDKNLLRRYLEEQYQGYLMAFAEFGALFAEFHHNYRITIVRFGRNKYPMIDPY